MTSYWMVGWIATALAVVWLVRRSLARRKPPRPLDIVLDDVEPSRPEPIELMELPTEDDTVPAVLSPPEWRVPRKAA